MISSQSHFQFVVALFVFQLVVQISSFCFLVVFNFCFVYQLFLLFGRSFVFIFCCHSYFLIYLLLFIGDFLLAYFLFVYYFFILLICFIYSWFCFVHCQFYVFVLLFLSFFLLLLTSISCFLVCFLLLLFSVVSSLEFSRVYFLFIQLFVYFRFVYYSSSSMSILFQLAFVELCSCYISRLVAVSFLLFYIHCQQLSYFLGSYIVFFTYLTLLSVVLCC